MNVIELTPERIKANDDLEIEIISTLGIDETSDPLVESGDYSNGFFHNEICVDLEDLKNGETSAFSVIQNIHDTAGISFRAYYGIDHYAILPNGVNFQAILDLCVEIFNRREELTNGLEIEWVNSNEKAVWYDDDGDTCETNEYWQKFSDTVSELDCREVYDMCFSENYDYVVEGVDEIVRDLPSNATSKELAEAVEKAGYYVTDSENIYIGHDDFFDKLAQERNVQDIN